MSDIKVGDMVEWKRKFDGRPFEGIVLEIVTPFAIVQPTHDSDARMWPWLDRLTKLTPAADGQETTTL